MSDTTSRVSRLSAYAALAGAALPAAASGAIVSQTGLNLTATPGSPLAIDFGPGFGEVFRFSVYTFGSATTFGTGTIYGGFTSGFSSFFFQSQVVQFDSGNAGGWTAASVMNYAGNADDDPQLLAFNAPINAAQGWSSMTNGFGTVHDLASSGRYFFSQYYSTFPSAGATEPNTGTITASSLFTGFDWAPNERGFLGVRFTKNGTDFHYAWFDVEADVANQTITIHGWGFEDEINTPVGAGVPSPGAVGLGLLAMGAAGIRRHRGRAA